MPAPSVSRASAVLEGVGPRAERHPLRHGRERRQRDDDVEQGIAERDVVARPDRVVAELLGRLRDLAVEAGVWHAADLLAAALDPEGDAHAPACARRTLRQAFS